MSDSNGTPRRLQRHRRANVRLPVRISTIDAETNPATGRPYFCSAEATSLDVSQSGIFISTDEPLSPGRRILVELDLPGGPSVQTVGRVCWARVRIPGESSERHAGIGIEFMGGTRGDLSLLARFVDRARRRPRAAETDARATGSNPAVPGA
jgi:hypothetical protein